MPLTGRPDLPTHAVLHIENATGGEDRTISLAYMHDGLFYHFRYIVPIPILEYEGDRIINSWELK
ncbi:MAG: hypothetical protein V3R32_04115 [Nitrosomonadaceae bacterium]